MVDEFILPGSRADEWRESAAAAELDLIESLKPAHRRPGTWKRLIGPWRRARTYLRSVMAKDHRRYGDRPFALQTFERFPWYVDAAAAHAYRTSTAISAVTATIQAVHMAIKLSGGKPSRSYEVKVPSGVCERERSQEARKVMALSATQARQIGKKWGALDATIVERMVGAAMELGFRKLLRFSDFCLVHVKYIY